MAKLIAKAKPFARPVAKGKLTPATAAKIRVKANRILGVLAFFALLVLPIHAAVQTFQVTIGAGTTQVSTVQVNCNWVVFQNNATHGMRIGDSATSSTKGISIVSGGGGFYQGALQYGESTNLQNWYVNGTNADVMDIVCDVVAH